MYNYFARIINTNLEKQKKSFYRNIICASSQLTYVYRYASDHTHLNVYQSQLNKHHPNLWLTCTKQYMSACMWVCVCVCVCVCLAPERKNKDPPELQHHVRTYAVGLQAKQLAHYLRHSAYESFNQPNDLATSSQLFFEHPSGCQAAAQESYSTTRYPRNKLQISIAS